MKSKRTFCEEAEKAPFPTTLSALLREQNITPGELASHLKISRQTVSNYCLGVTSPSFPILCEIADRFNVSTDYLLGRTDVKSPHAETQAIAAATGLSERNIAVLQSFLHDGKKSILQNLFNEILEFAFDVEVISGYAGMCASLSIQNNQDIISDPMERLLNHTRISEYAKNEGYALLSGEEAFRFYCAQIAEHIQHALHDRHIAQAVWKKEGKQNGSD